jgi:hypothetical protein
MDDTTQVTLITIVAVLSSSIILVFALMKLTELRKALLIAAFLISGSTGFLVGSDFLQWLSSNSAQETRTGEADHGATLLGGELEIYFSAEDISQGTELSSGSYTSVLIPSQYMMDFYITEEAYVDGAMALFDLRRGMILTYDHIFNPDAGLFTEGSAGQ